MVAGYVRWADDYGGRAAGRAGSECLAGAGDLGLFRPVGQPLGADLPAVCAALVCVGGASDCDIRLVELLIWLWRAAKIQINISVGPG